MSSGYWAEWRNEDEYGGESGLLSMRFSFLSSGPSPPFSFGGQVPRFAQVNILHALAAELQEGDEPFERASTWPVAYSPLSFYPPVSSTPARSTPRTRHAPLLSLLFSRMSRPNLVKSSATSIYACSSLIHLLRSANLLLPLSRFHRRPRAE